MEHKPTVNLFGLPLDLSLLAGDSKDVVPPTKGQQWKNRRLLGSACLSIKKHPNFKARKRKK